MAQAELSISARGESNEILLTAHGDIDMSTVGQLTAAVTAALADRPSRIVLDLAGVTVCDSLGMGTLVVLSRQAARAQCQLILVNVGRLLLRALDITGLRSALLIH